MNKVIITGNVTKDLELKKTNSGISNVSFTVAVQRKFKDANGNRETDFLTVVAWRQLADICAQYVSKGSKVGVVGSIQTRNYTAQDGSKRYVTEIIADDVEFLGSRGERANDNNEQYQAAPVAKPQQAKAQDITSSSVTSGADYLLGQDEDLPF